MVAKSSNHTPAGFQMLTGFTMNGFRAWDRGSLTASARRPRVCPRLWCCPTARPAAGGSINWTNGFLPATYQGVAFRATGDPVRTCPRRTAYRRPARRESEAARSDESRFHRCDARRQRIDRRIRSYELAAKMQTAIPEVVNLAGETAETRRLYGWTKK